MNFCSSDHDATIIFFPILLMIINMFMVINQIYYKLKQVHLKQFVCKPVAVILAYSAVLLLI